VSLAEIDLERSTIRSPVDGLVIARTISEGQTVAVSLEAPTLFTIAGDLSEMEIHARVDEMDIGSIAAGQEAVFTVDARPDREFFATVRQVRKAPEVLQNVVTYTVVLVTDNKEDLLLPGLTATVRISTLETDPTLKVPLAALSFAPDGDQPAESAAADPSGRRMGRIWIAGAEGPVRPVTVELGEEDSNHVAVKSGPVHAGDKVVVGQTAEPVPRSLFGIRIGF
jgi:HlyD family secretion protein